MPEQVFQDFRVTNRQRAVIEHSAAGDNTIIAAPAADLRIRIVHLNLIAQAAVNARLKSGAATNLSGPYSLLARSGMIFDANGGVWTLDCNPAEAFVINLSAPNEIDGFVLYFLERV